jgi:hypothetical protein
MTSEIIVMNRHGAAVAADSAVTLRGIYGPKFLSANKIYEIANDPPVVALCSGRSDLGGVPLELLFHEFKRKLNGAVLNGLEEYVDTFIRFLDTGNAKVGDVNEPFISNEVSRDEMVEDIVSITKAIYSNAVGFSDFRISQPTPVGSQDDVSERHKRMEELRRINTKVLMDTLDDMISEIGAGTDRGEYGRVKGAFEKSVSDIDLKERMSRQLFLRVDVETVLPKIKEYFFILLAKNIPSVYLRGSDIVFVGYGGKDLFPASEQLHLTGYYLGKTYYNTYSASKVSPEAPAMVIPFAEQMQSQRFLYGFDDQTFSSLEHNMDFVLRAEMIRCGMDKDKADLASEHIKGMIESRVDRIKNNSLDRIYSVVQAMSKADLAQMAEFMVEINSFEKRVSPSPETVGGATDVAVLSREDGLIWVKKKQYYDRSNV